MNDSLRRQRSHSELAMMVPYTPRPLDIGWEMFDGSEANDYRHITKLSLVSGSQDDTQRAAFSTCRTTGTIVDMRYLFGASPSLCLLPWHDSAAPALLEFLSDERLYRFISDVHPQDVDHVVRLHGPRHPGTHLVFTVHVAHPTALPIGFVSLDRSGPDEYTIGYLLSPAHHGVGLSSSMIALALDKLKPIGRTIIKAAVDSNNVPSLRALEKNGFIEVDRLDRILHFKPSTDVILQKVLNGP